MHDRELFEKAFSPLHASPDTLTEVRKTMRNEKKTRRALGKGAVIAIAAALTLTIAVAGGIVTLIRADVSPADKVDDTTHHAFNRNFIVGGAFMQKQAIPKEPVASYKEVRIGKTLYRVTSVFSGEKDLGRTLEQLAVRRAMTELDAPAAAQPCHAS